MSSQPSSGTEAPPSWPDRYAGVALAGFACGLTSLIPTLLLLGALLRRVALPFMSIDQEEQVICGTFLLALLGLMLSVRGRHSTSRRWLAIAGAVLSAIAALFIVLAVGYFYYRLYVDCHKSATGCF